MAAPEPFEPRIAITRPGKAPVVIPITYRANGNDLLVSVVTEMITILCDMACHAERRRRGERSVDGRGVTLTFEERDASDRFDRSARQLERIFADD